MARRKLRYGRRSKRRRSPSYGYGKRRRRRRSSRYYSVSRGGIRL